MKENVKRKVADLKEYPGNPREMTDSMKKKLKKSIETFDLVEPLVINKDNEVIGGNQRLIALRSLGMDSKEIDCVKVDLPKGKEKALNIALNKISGDFHETKLNIMLEELEDEEITLAGIDIEIEPLDVKPEEIGYEEKNLKLYKKVHILLSMNPNKLQEIKKSLEEIQKVEGIEYEQSAN